MGFIDDIETIVEAVPDRPSDFIVFATWDGGVINWRAKDENPEVVEVERGRSRQNRSSVVLRYALHKNRLLDHLRDANIDQCVILYINQSHDRSHRDELYEKRF